PEHRDPLALRVLRITVTVRGNAKQGKRPYVQFENAKYRSVVLSNNSGLIGKKLILHVYTEDLRSVRAFFEDHTELGLLKAQGVWGLSKHDLTTRKTICKLRHDKLLYF